MSQDLITPVRQNERIRVIDTIRGIALLGILMMNMPYFANPEIQADNLNVMNEYTGPNYYTWFTIGVFFEGTMRGLFSILFGAGCILLLHRLENKKMAVTPADIYYRRLLWLFLFGMINAFILLWPGDILYSYAICGLFLYPFRNMKAKHLLMFSIAFLVFATMKGTYNYYKVHNVRVEGEKALALEKQTQTLTENQKQAKDKWTGYLERKKPESLKKEAQKDLNAVKDNSYFGLLGYFSGINARIQSKLFYNSYFFDIMTLLFLGMALFKWNVLTGKRSSWFYLILMLSGYGIGLTLSYWEHSTKVNLKFDSSLYLQNLYVDFYELRRILITLGHLSLVILLYKKGIFKILWQWLSKVGQMAFTNYLMQSIICGIIFYGFGFGLFGQLQRYETYYVVLAIWVFQIIFSNIWLHYYRFGPFEWVWRSLTYWRKPSMKKSSLAATDEHTEIPALAHPTS